MPHRFPQQQLDLFDAAPQAATPAKGRALGAAAVSPELQTVAERLPATIRIGTSSWSFPGWAGIVYDQEVSPTRLARQGLVAYAQHPLLRAVGIDRTFYAPIPAAAFAEYAAAVPAHFRFLVKAHELCTLARFPRHERYGAQRGELNNVCLNADYAAAEVVGPCLDGLGDRLGPLLFQFPPQDLEALGGASGFAERLHRFLGALPRGPLYAVELRSPELLTPDYAAALNDVGACHCLNGHPSMPTISEQGSRVGTKSPALVVRWMLARHFAYDEAKAHYAPFNRLVDEDPDTRVEIAGLCREAVARGRRAYVIINNKAEGSAPLSAFRLAGAIVGGR